MTPRQRVEELLQRFEHGTTQAQLEAMDARTLRRLEDSAYGLGRWMEALAAGLRGELARRDRMNRLKKGFRNI